MGVIEQHGALMALPPTPWFQETFPGHPAWETMPNDKFFRDICAYLNSWEVVLAEWDQGHFSRLRPEMLMPWPGLRKMVAWSAQRAQEKQQQLTGMSASMTTFNLQNFARHQQASTT